MALRQPEETTIEAARNNARLTRIQLMELLHAEGIACSPNTVNRWCLTGRVRTDIYNVIARIINERLPEGSESLPTVPLWVFPNGGPDSTVGYPPSRPWSVSALVASV